MQLTPRAVIRLQASRSFHRSSCCAKQELFEEWQRPLNKTQLKVVYKAQARSNPKYNTHFRKDAAVLLHKAYSRTTEERNFDKATLQQLRNIIRERAGNRFDVVNISTHTYALPLRGQPAEFLIVDSQYPNGRKPDVLDEYSVVYDTNAFMALLEEHGLKCFEQHVSKNWSNKNVHGREHGSTGGYGAPVTLHVNRSAGQPMELDGMPITSIIPSISFSLTLPHPVVLPLNRLFKTYFRLAPEIPEAWSLLLLWIRSLGLGTSTPGMKSVDNTPDLTRVSEGRDTASRSLPYVEELSPTCLALLFIVYLVETKRLPNLFARKYVLPQGNEPQPVWVPYTYRSSSHHLFHSQAQVGNQRGQQCNSENTLAPCKEAIYPQDNSVQTSAQIDVAFARHITKVAFRIKTPKLINLFFEYLSACARSRSHSYSLREGAKVERDISSHSQSHQESATQIKQIESAEHVSERQHESWKLHPLVVQDPFIITHNHSAFVSSITLHRVTQCAKMAQKTVVNGYPLWAMFGQHLKSPTVPSAYPQPQNAADARTEDNRQVLRRSPVAEMAGSSTSATDRAKESPPHLCGISNRRSGHWGGLRDIQKQTGERTDAELEDLQSLENERMQAKSNMDEQVTGNYDTGPRLKPAIHRRPPGVSQFSRRMHTSAAPPLTKDEETGCNPSNEANRSRIEIDASNSPPIDKRNTRDQLICEVKHAIKVRYGRRYDVQPYGSSVYMIEHGPDDSDLDLIVLDSKWPRGFAPDIDMKHLPVIYNTRGLARVMRYAGFTDVEAIPWARVPIVKFTDPASGLKVDINVNERLGLLNTDLIKTYCDIVPCLRYLVSAIKGWARPRALNNPSAPGLRTFNSYALVLMTIAWLQTMGLAPKLQVGLQQMEANEHLFWMRPSHPSKRTPCDTRYHKSTTWVAPPVGTSLDDLMEQWFRFWTGFQFPRHVIDIKRGGIYPRVSYSEETANHGDVPRGHRPETWGNLSALHGPDVDPTTMLESYPISVVDPFIRSKNVTKGLNGQSLNLFQAECKNASELLKLGANMTDVIDRFDSIKQDFNRYQKARPTHVDPSAGSHAAAASLREISAHKLTGVFDAIDPWNPQTSNHSKGDGRIPLSEALRSSRVTDETIAGLPKGTALGDEQVRDDDEGFGLKESYFKMNRRI